MTYRHHKANLEEIEQDYAIYSYTPDSIDNKHWGKVKFSLSDPNDYKIIIYPDDGLEEEWQHNVCSALARSFHHFKEQGNGKIPEEVRCVA